MSEILTFSTDETRPDRAAVFENQGIPAGAGVTQDVKALYDAALRLLGEVAAPRGMFTEMSKTDFAVVYSGEGRNEPRTPIGDIFGRADDLALFAVTLGERVGREITQRFQSNELALGAMLDSAASAAADKLAELVETRFGEALPADGRGATSTGVLRYSPGYCGWDISGQKKLFEFLHPERIGIALRESFLMEPLKSVSGVLIAGPKEIHDVEMSYPFCDRCDTRGCRERIRALLAE
ncbi:MAG TPA: vitamin B12 dependent-methionine synthase activation domain-containing protein [Phycisphaerae bacterium]|nr:vitamin B12 dependent-methionine synthase activation domain-containing protein [Phycisphaerae bacterium]